MTELPILDKIDQANDLALPILESLNLANPDFLLRDRSGYLANSQGYAALEERIATLSRGIDSRTLASDDMENLYLSYILEYDPIPIKLVKQAEIKLASALACDADRCDPIRFLVDFHEVMSIAQGSFYNEQVGPPVIQALKQIAESAVRKFSKRNRDPRTECVDALNLSTDNSDLQQFIRDLHGRSLFRKSMEQLMTQLCTGSEEFSHYLYPKKDSPKLCDPTVNRNICWNYIPTNPVDVVHLLNHTVLTPGRRFADIGSGCGAVALPVGRLTEFEVTGYEFETALVEQGNQFVAENGFSNTCFKQHDLTKDPFPLADVYFVYSPFLSGTAEIHQLVENLVQQAQDRPVAIWAHYGALIQLLVENDKDLECIGNAGEVYAFASRTKG